MPEHGERPKGTLTVYDRKGNSIYVEEDFHAGHDKMPAGVAISAGGTVIVEPKTGEVLARWDPWNVLGSKDD